MILLLLRGTAGLLLGIAVLTTRQDPPVLATLFAVYWLVASVITIRWAVTLSFGQGRGFGLVAGTIGILAAVALLARLEIAGLIGVDGMRTLLGLAMILAGSFRILGHFRDEARLIRRLPLGLLEIGAGVALIAASATPGPLLAIFVGAWALLGGAFAYLDVRRLRAQLAARA